MYCFDDILITLFVVVVFYLWSRILGHLDCFYKHLLFVLMISISLSSFFEFYERFSLVSSIKKFPRVLFHYQIDFVIIAFCSIRLPGFEMWCVVVFWILDRWLCKVLFYSLPLPIVKDLMRIYLYLYISIYTQMYMFYNYEILYIL